MSFHRKTSIPPELVGFGSSGMRIANPSDELRAAAEATGLYIFGHPDPLPDGLRDHNGEIQFECCVCGHWTEWPAEIEDFDIDDNNNVCGGSPRCCP